MSMQVASTVQAETVMAMSHQIPVLEPGHLSRRVRRSPVCPVITLTLGWCGRLEPLNPPSRPAARLGLQGSGDCNLLALLLSVQDGQTLQKAYKCFRPSLCEHHVWPDQLFFKQGSGIICKDTLLAFPWAQWRNLWRDYLVCSNSKLTHTNCKIQAYESIPQNIPSYLAK